MNARLIAVDVGEAFLQNLEWTDLVFANVVRDGVNG
jgi:hypothetical protein